MNSITFNNNTNQKLIEEKELKKLIKYAVKEEKLKNVIFSITLVDNNMIKELNNQYRNIDKPTDVISFALEDNDDYINPDCRLLGDIYISIEKALEQADNYGHSYLRELSFLMIHGFLHLLGYDHQNTDDEIKMFKRQEEILNGYGIKK
jgi:probable rRNA maturation factor